MFYHYADPKSGDMDFRALLRHKDRKKRKGVDEGPDWGDLKSCKYSCPTKESPHVKFTVSQKRSFKMHLCFKSVKYFQFYGWIKIKYI